MKKKIKKIINFIKNIFYKFKSKKKEKLKQNKDDIYPLY